MARGMAIAARPSLGKCESDHRSKCQRCGERVLSSECICGRREDLIVVTIEFCRPPGDNACGSIQGGPGHKKCQGLKHTAVALRIIERTLQIGFHRLSTLRPFEQHADVVHLLAEAVALLEIFGETALPLQRLLRLGLVVPEIRRGDLLFELG